MVLAALLGINHTYMTITVIRLVYGLPNGCPSAVGLSWPGRAERQQSLQT